VDERLYDQFADIGDRHWWFGARRQIIGAVLRDVLPADPERNLLDVGCGTGTMLGMLSAFGSVHGLEMSPEAIEACRVTYGDAVDVRQGSVPDDVPSDASFEVVAAFDVIEHLDDDASALQALREATRPGGLLVVTVPAFMFLWGQQDELSHHRRRYRRGELRDAIEDAGFVIDRMTYFNTWLFPLVAAIRVTRRLLPGRNRPPGSDFDMSSRGVDRVLERVFASERHLLRRVSFPFGVSLLALARRPE
jgi:SAM-dependent methyltransferase